MIAQAEKIQVEDGIHDNVPFEDYLLWDCMSKSVLTNGLADGMGSMLRLKAAVDGELPHKESDALSLGTAFDTRLLTPELFKSEYTVSETCCAVKKKDGQPCENAGIERIDGKWYCGTHKPKDATPDAINVITSDMWEKVHCMFASVLNHPIIHGIRQSGGEQVSMAWTDPATGIKMKGRLDKWVSGHNLIIDVKTTRACNIFELSRDFIKWGYHLQHAMYREAMQVLHGQLPDFLFCYVESEPPYEVGVFRPDPETTEYGLFEYHNTLGKWANCLKTGVYPGKWGNDIQEIHAPEYKLKTLEYADLSNLVA